MVLKVKMAWKKIGQVSSRILIYKSDAEYDKSNPYIVSKGDIRASFKTKSKAIKFARTKMPYYYIDPITYQTKFGTKVVK